MSNKIFAETVISAVNSRVVADSGMADGMGIYELTIGLNWIDA